MSTTTTNPTKGQLIDALSVWIHQRPGLEYGNYGEPTSYRAECRQIRKDLHDARALLRSVELSQITGTELLAAFHAFSGRMTWTEKGLEYCTGQYWPTEYRKVVAAICAKALWDYHREDYTADAKPGESAGDAIRRNFMRRFGRAMQARWFN